MPRAKREKLAEPTRFRRLPQSKSSKVSIDAYGGYRRQGIIRDVSVTTAGEALGHGVWLDQEFVEATTQQINRYNKGVKARFTHPGLSSDGLGNFLGRVMNARTEGHQTIADLHFSQAGHNTPDGDLAKYVMDLAAEDPESFGLSIVYEPDTTAEDSFLSEHVDEQGKFASPDQNNKQNLPHARLATLRAADVVDEPAANPQGLFRREQQFAEEATAIAEYALGLIDERPPVVALGLDADRVAGFVKQFLANHKLEIKQMADESAPAVEEPQPNKFPVEATPVTEEQPATETPLSMGQKYVAAFGDKGAVWFLEGKSFEECQQLQNQSQSECIVSLEAKCADLEKRLAAATKAAGEPVPVDFQSGETNDEKRKGLASKLRLPASATK